jgi:dsDNA-binding SOS-regulon protein
LLADIEVDLVQEDEPEINPLQNEELSLYAKEKSDPLNFVHDEKKQTPNEVNAPQPKLGGWEDDEDLDIDI